MKPSDSEYRASGISAAPGIAIGPAYIIDRSGVPVPEYEIASSGIEAEIARLHTAIGKARRQIAQLKQKAAALWLHSQHRRLYRLRGQGDA